MHRCRVQEHAPDDAADDAAHACTAGVDGQLLAILALAEPQDGCRGDDADDDGAQPEHHGVGAGQQAADDGGAVDHGHVGQRRVEVERDVGGVRGGGAVDHDRVHQHDDQLGHGAGKSSLDHEVAGFNVAGETGDHKRGQAAHEDRVRQVVHDQKRGVPRGQRRHQIGVAGDHGKRQAHDDGQDAGPLRGDAVLGAAGEQEEQRDRDELHDATPQLEGDAGHAVAVTGEQRTWRLISTISNTEMYQIQNCRRISSRKKPKKL